MKKILCVGHSAYDITYLLPHFPAENRKYKAKDRIMVSGGPAGNAAYLLGKYGENVSYITALGSDFYGKKILEDLNEVGVDTKNIVVSNKLVTPCSIIIANEENGSRTIINYREEKPVDDFKMIYEKAPEIILYDGHELDISLKIHKEFPNAVSVLDAGTYKEGTLVIGKFVDYLVCSEDFAKDYCKMDKIDEKDFKYVLEKLEELNKNTIIVTLGERGSIMKKDGEVLKFKAFKTKAVDTTGAGDIFHGAFVYGLSNGFSIEKNIEFASACASLSVEKLGGRNSIPELDEVEKRIKRG
ncbi:carbohydrate kinase family protein [uncultured Fusobacterium sp.]|uniref:carbohydrate kinase family protein n=1 Tax=uncultured Fusobacterium sp. TaxID=159267 RepID=UPI0027DB09C5|nr:carbohydrate kinase family protein [uncultured Fusobacterium sp.]